ncbi:MAG: hypothetical protein ABI947_17340 [Chloroflexota bacterium]
MNDRDLMPEDGMVQQPEESASEETQSVVTPPFPMSEQDLVDPDDADYPEYPADDEAEESDNFEASEANDAEDRAYYAPTSTRRRVYTAPPPPPIAEGRGYACADVITALFLLMTIAVCAVTVLLYANPQSPLNPFPPPTWEAIKVIATDPPTNTPTATFTPLPFTATPLDTATPTATATATATWTPTVTETPVVGGGAGPTVTETLQLVILSPSPQFTLSPFPFTVEPGRYSANKSPDACNWQSIAGSVTDLAGKPIKGLAIRVTGSNGNIDEVHYTGTEPRFGESGFEVFLGAIPRQDQYTVQLLGRTGAPVSDTVTVQTHTGCNENVVIVNFVQNHSY